MRRFTRIAWALPVVLPVAVGLVGAWLGMVVAGGDTIRLDPFTVDVQASVGRGETAVALPPFGRVRADTHTAPLRITATLREVDVRRLGQVPRGVSTSDLAAAVEREARAAAPRYALRLLGVAAGGALGLALLVHRKDLRRVGIAVATALVLVGAAETAAWRTYRPDAFAEPTFSGALTLAPRLIGSVGEVGERIDEFRAELARIVDGAVRAYTTIETDGAAPGDEVRVLHVSDIHLSPLGIDFALAIARGFDVDAVLDTGDLTSYGTPAEELILSQIPRFDRPYVFVRGNHDTVELQDAMADGVPNAVVLDGTAESVDGLLVYGLGHPVFTEDATSDVGHPEFVRRAEEAVDRIRSDLGGLPRDPDIVAVHDDRMTEGLSGRVPVVASGHYHASRTSVRDRTIFLRVGSTGGAGVNVFSAEGGVPLSAEILTFRRGPDPELVAYDRIEQSPLQGNLTVRRHRVDDETLADEAERHRREVDRILRLARTPEPAASPADGRRSPDG